MIVAMLWYIAHSQAAKDEEEESLTASSYNALHGVDADDTKVAEGQQRLRASDEPLLGPHSVEDSRSSVVNMLQHRWRGNNDVTISNTMMQVWCICAKPVILEVIISHDFAGGVFAGTALINCFKSSLGSSVYSKLPHNLLGPSTCA